MIKRLKYLFYRSSKYAKEFAASKKGSASYWTAYMVDNREFTDIESSLKHFRWRNSQYPGYIDLMPVEGHDGKVIVDYGCGPGNDLVGFSVWSIPKKLIGLDVSTSALNASKNRLELHGKNAQLIQIQEDDNAIPLESNSVDLVHSSGVLHHCKNLDAVLKELHRILKVNGEMQIMIYNYDSIWLHLYTAFILQIERGTYSEDDIYEAFRKTTDGPFCPIAKCYRPDEFIQIVEGFGFKGEFTGASTSLTEMKIQHRRFEAMEDFRLAEEHRDFLAKLIFDNKQIAHYQGNVAGINACFRFKKIK